MKQILLIIALVSTFSATGIAQVKIGHVNSQEILAALPERAVNEEKVQNFAKQKELKIQGMYNEYQEMIQKFQSLPEDATQTERTDLQNQIVDIEKRIQDNQTEAQSSIQAFENELIGPMVDKVRNAINAVAAENGFSYILDTSSGLVVYMDGGEDIGPLVKQNLGLQ